MTGVLCTVGGAQVYLQDNRCHNIHLLRYLFSFIVIHPQGRIVEDLIFASD